MVKESSINVFRCKNCLNMSTRPRITFDERGWCNACQWMEEKKSFNWVKREKELERLLAKYRSKRGEFDCAVPVSGGKDGSYIAYTLKTKYGMNPLCINVTPPLPEEIGEENLKNFAASGFNLIQLHLNSEIMRFIDKRGFIDKGFPYFGWLIAIRSAVIRTAAQFDLSLIFYGEDGELEYGGSTETKNTTLQTIDYQKKIYFEEGYDEILNQMPEELKRESVFWRFPDENILKEKEIYTTAWSYFENWDPYRNYLIAKEHCGLLEKEDTNLGTFTNFSQNDQRLYALHTYLMYLKFGFGRAVQDAGIEIRRGAMSRDQGLNLIKMYDGSYPEDNIETYLNYYQMSNEEFDAVIDHHVNKELFVKQGDRWWPKFTIE